MSDQHDQSAAIGVDRVKAGQDVASSIKYTARARRLLLLLAVLAGAAVTIALSQGWLDCAVQFLGYSADPERKEGDWKVTTLGQLRFARHLDKEHRLLVACYGKAPELWDTMQGHRVAVLYDHRGAVGSATRSPDGKYFVTAQDIGVHDTLNERNIVRSLWIWKSASGKLLKRIDVDLSAKGVRRSTDWDLEWIGEGKLLLQLHRRANPARASGQTVLGEMDVGSGRVTRWSDALQISEHLIMSPDGKRAMATRENGIYRGPDGVVSGGRGTTFDVPLVDMEAFRVISTLDEAKQDSQGKFRSIVGAVWSPDGHRTATVGSDHTVGIWDGLTGKPMSHLEGHTDFVRSVSFSPDGDRVLTASDDRTARVWEAKTGKPITTLTGHALGLTDAAFGANGQMVLTGAEDQTARLWDSGSGKQLRIFADHESGLRHVAFEDNGELICTLTARGIERHWSTSDGSLLVEVESEKKAEIGPTQKYGVCFLRGNGGITEMWVGPKGASPPIAPDTGQKFLAIGPMMDSDDPSTAGLAEPRLVLKGHKGWIQSLALSPDGATLVSAGLDGEILLWKPAEWDRVTGKGRTALARDQGISQVAISPDGRTLATSHTDGVIRLRDPATGKELRSHNFHSQGVGFIAFSSDSSRLMIVSSTSDKRYEAKSWDFGGDAEDTLVSGTCSTVTQAVLSRDGRALAVGYPVGDDRRPDQPGEAVVWDTVSAEEVCRLRGHSGWVDVLAFTPNGKLLVTGSTDKTARLWDAASGKERMLLSGHTDVISALAISPDGRQLASGDWDSVVRLWDLTSGKEQVNFKVDSSRSRVTVLAYTGDGKALVSGSGDGTVKFWDVDKLLKSAVNK
jgi:WD40 repeat protein